MQAILEQRSHLLPYDRERTWPLDARMAMFVLEAGGQDPQFIRQRQSERHPRRIIATVCGPDPRLLAHGIIYVRDMNDGHLGFICQNNLPIGERVMVHCATEDGQTVRLADFRDKRGPIRRFGDALQTPPQGGQRLDKATLVPK